MGKTKKPSPKRGSAGMGLPETLSDSAIETIVATAGAVAPKALDITKTFYGKMLSNNPDLLTYFNPAHNVPISAGIGVTPMVNFSRALGDKVKLVVHVDKTKESFPFRSHFEEAGHPMEVVYTKQAGRPSVANLAKVTVAKAGTDNNFYICGPEKWMEQMQAELLKQGARKVMCEVFGSQLGTGCPFAAGR